LRNPRIVTTSQLTNFMKNRALTLLAGALLAAAPLSHAATFTVTQTSGGTTTVGSLAWALFQAYWNSPGADTIAFNVGGGGAQTVFFPGGVTVGGQDGAGVTIDGTTQPGYAGNPLITINGSGIQTPFTLVSSSCTIRGLAIVNYTAVAIAIISPSVGNTIESNWVGFSNFGGSTYTTNSSYGYLLTIGIGVATNYNNIYFNTVSGVDNGITVGTDPVAAPASGLVAGVNNIMYNVAGPDPTGNFTIQNTSDGLFLGDGTGYNYIGYNNFSANLSAGIELLAPLCFSNYIYGNYIGVGYNTGQLGNGELGILVSNGAQYNNIGSYAANWIGYNGLGGINLGLSATGAAPGTISPAYSNGVYNNYVTGNGSFTTSANEDIGVGIEGFSAGNVVQGNVIYGQAQHGVILGGVQSNYVLYNYLGPYIGNGGFGVFLQNSSFNVIGGNAFFSNALGPIGEQNSSNNSIF